LKTAELNATSSLPVLVIFLIVGFGFGGIQLGLAASLAADYC
jgi:hypothetical protein